MAQARAAIRRPRNAAPIMPKPRIMVSQVAGSGTPPGCADSSSVAGPALPSPLPGGGFCATWEPAWEKASAAKK